MGVSTRRYELKTAVYNLLEQEDYTPLELREKLDGFEYADASGYKQKVGEYNKQCNYLARLIYEYLFNKKYFNRKKEDNNEEARSYW